MATTGIRNEWSITDEQRGDKQAYSQNIFKIWNHFLSVSKFGCCEMVKKKQIKQIYLMYCCVNVFLKDKAAFCNTPEIYFSAYWLLWVNNRISLLSPQCSFCSALFRQFIQFIVKLRFFVCLFNMYDNILDNPTAFLFLANDSCICFIIVVMLMCKPSKKLRCFHVIWCALLFLLFGR